VEKAGKGLGSKLSTELLTLATCLVQYRGTFTCSLHMWAWNSRRRLALRSSMTTRSCSSSCRMRWLAAYYSAWRREQIYERTRRAAERCADRSCIRLSGHRRIATQNLSAVKMTCLLDLDGWTQRRCQNQNQNQFYFRVDVKKTLKQLIIIWATIGEKWCQESR